MNREKFTKQVVQKRIDKILDVLDFKAIEYSTDG